jgi:hypothetical protein
MLCFDQAFPFWVAFWVNVVFVGGYALGCYHERKRAP